MGKEYTLSDLATCIKVAKAIGELPDSKTPVNNLWDYKQVWLANAEEHINDLSKMFRDPLIATYPGRSELIRAIYKLILQRPKNEFGELEDITADYLSKKFNKDKHYVKQFVMDLERTGVIKASHFYNGKKQKEPAYIWDPNLVAGHQWIASIILDTRELKTIDEKLVP
jgi:hypothetical protein